jgi:hypothetical protein
MHIYTNMSTLKQLAEETFAKQSQPISQAIKHKTFEILEEAENNMVLDNNDLVGIIYAALYAARILKLREDTSRGTYKEFTVDVAEDDNYSRLVLRFAHQVV